MYAKELKIKPVKGGVTAPLGFLAAGVSCGIKPPPLLDLALIVSEKDGPVAGVFTKNRIPAAPVILDRRHLKKRIGRAIIVNSGNANACTGTQGIQDSKEMAMLVAKGIGSSCTKIFVGSTGVIGPRLPLTKIRQGFPFLLKRLRKSGYREAAQAIMTTDTTIKETAVQTKIDGKIVTIGGMAKGSGMIHPDMATMLAYVTTDAAITAKVLQSCLHQAVETSFNCISVDGETSTNDTVLCLANGLSENAIIQTSSLDCRKFQDALNYVCQSLAMKICQDGEGATKIVQFLVEGAPNTHDAKQIANTLATSPLVKTALFGEDVNWGRIIMAIGRSGPPIQTDQLAIKFDNITILQKGKETKPSQERKAQKVMRKKTFTITVRVGKGKGKAKIWTTDLSYDYVKINASYRS